MRTGIKSWEKEGIQYMLEARKRFTLEYRDGTSVHVGPVGGGWLFVRYGGRHEPGIIEVRDGVARYGGPVAQAALEGAMRATGDEAASAAALLSLWGGPFDGVAVAHEG